MELGRVNKETLKKVRDYAFSNGKIRIGQIQREFSLSFIKARDIFNCLVDGGIGETNKEGILIVHYAQRTN